MRWVYLREGQDVRQLDRLLFYLIGGSIIGARLGHCLFYDPVYYFENPIKILAVWEGGLASHGGGIGVLVSVYLFKRKTDISYLWLLDRLVVPTALAAFFIRIGNFFNSEIVGVPTSVPWAVIFERVDSIPRHPVQLYEAISYILIFTALFLGYKYWKWMSRAGVLSGLFLVLVFTARIIIEFVKTKQEAYSIGLWASTGQLLSVPFVLAGIALILIHFISRERGKR